MNCEYYEKITDYLDNNLSNLEKVQFEKYLDKDKEFKNIVDDLKFQSKLIQELPKAKTSSNFIINLNNRIDEHETKNKYLWSNIFKFKLDYIPLLGALSILSIISFSLFKISNYSPSSYALDNNKFEGTVAINDLDSLENEYDDSPILLIGNEK